MATWLTNEDVQNYGHELVDFAQRAAAHALAPTLQQIEQSNAELQRRLAIEARRNLDQRVAAAVPNFREIDQDPNWHRWLLGTDALSGRVRQQLLNDAIQSGSESRIAAFFQKFQREAGGTQAAPAASGRTRQTSGKPIYDNARIKELYAAHRRGDFNGREAEWARIEADLFAAQREGRVLSHYLPGK